MYYDFSDDIEAICTPRETREDVVEYYQWKYKGIKNTSKGPIYEWKSRLVKDIQQYTRAKNGAPMTEKNIARRFQERKGVDPLSKPVKSRQQIAEYRALGATLPPKPPEGGIKVTGKIGISYGGNTCEQRTIRPDHPVILRGNVAMLFLDDEEQRCQGIVNLYMEQGIAYEETDVVFFACEGGGDNDFVTWDVTLEENEGQGTSETFDNPFDDDFDEE